MQLAVAVMRGMIFGAEAKEPSVDMTAAVSVSAHGLSIWLAMSTASATCIGLHSIDSLAALCMPAMPSRLVGVMLLAAVDSALRDSL